MDTYTAAGLARLYVHGTRHTQEMIRDLSQRAYEYRMQVLRMVYGRKTGHIGSTLIASAIAVGSDVSTGQQVTR